MKKGELIETFPSVPADQAAKVKEMTSEEKTAFFRKWVKERVDKVVVHGVYILVCKDPTKIETYVSEKVRSAISPKQVYEPLLMEFRKKRFDEGLLAVVKVVQEKLEKAKSE